MECFMKKTLGQICVFLFLWIPSVRGQCPENAVNCITSHKVHCHFLKNHPAIDLQLAFHKRFEGVIKATLPDKQQCKLYSGNKKGAKILFIKIDEKSCPGFEKLKEGDSIKTNVTVQFDPDIVQIVDKLYQVECSPSKLYYEAIVGTTVNNAFTGRSGDESADADMIEVKDGREFPSVMGQPMTIVMGESEPSMLIDSSITTCRLIKGSSASTMGSPDLAKKNEMGSFEGEKEKCSTYNKLGYFMKEILHMNINDSKSGVRKKILWIKPKKDGSGKIVPVAPGDTMTLVCDIVACKTLNGEHGSTWSSDNAVCEEQKCREIV